MKRWKPAFSYRVGLLLSLSLFYSCATAQPPAPPRPAIVSKAETPQLRLRYVGLGRLDQNTGVQGKLTVENTLPEALQVEKGELRLMVDGKSVDVPSTDFFGTVSFPFTMAPHSERTIDFFYPLEEHFLVDRRDAEERAAEESHRLEMTAELRVASDGTSQSQVLKAREESTFPRIREPIFTIAAIRILQAELINTRFLVTLRIDNPNPFPVELSNFSYELYGDRRFWADGQVKDVLRVEGRTSTDRQIALVMNFIDMRRELLDRIIALKSVDYRFKGQAQISLELGYIKNFESSFDQSGAAVVSE